MARNVNQFTSQSPAAWVPDEEVEPPQPIYDKIHLLVARQDLAGLNAYLDETGFRDVNLTDAKGRTPLHIAAAGKSADIVRQLLRRGAFVQACGTHVQATPLHFACAKGNFEIARILLKYGASLDAVTTTGHTPLALLPRTPDSKKFAKAVLQPLPPPKPGKKEKELLQAIATNDELAIIELIHAGADINTAEPSDLLTPLMLAAKQGNENLVRLFLYHCADVHRQDVDKNTALHWACTRGNLNIVQMLCEFDAAVNLPEKGGWYTPFHWAVLKGNIDVALYLVHECHANPLLPDKEGSTPLHTACRLGTADTVNALLSIRGIDANAADAYGVRPLHVAVRRGGVVGVGGRSDVAVTEALLKSGAVDVNAATVTFATALHDAAVEANPEITRLLLQYGGNAIDVNARMLDGSFGARSKTPLHMLVTNLDDKRTRKGMSNLLTIIKLLGERGADPNLRNDADRTPLLSLDPNYVLQEGTLEHVVARALVVAGTDLGISFRVGTAISQSTRERDQIREMVNLLKERYEQDIRLPPGWTKIGVNDNVILVDSENRVGVYGAPLRRTESPSTMWLQPNDSRLVPLMPLRDETAQPTPARQMALADFACPLCMELLYKPCTIDCGHNVCQPCLMEAVNFHSSCPICRKPFKKPTGPPNINTMLSAVLERAFPERYLARHMDYLASVNGNGGTTA